jgi:sulfoxide reductase heme-binding subunit YedZ
VTSTAGWIRRLGGKTWNRLHMLVYITAAAAVLHYYWKVSIKLPPDNPRNYGILVAMLLAFRVWRHFARRRASEV